ncbi:hypothetical protein EIP86_009908 [Pleurotus ostreatoroseus]|nr:hypothetical protein EIP86_009908 [Pleurotus ostreatoroseus]
MPPNVGYVSCASPATSLINLHQQYDIGFNFLRRTERQAEVNAKIARERKAWEAEQQRRREERLRRMREQQQAREERMRASAERVQREKADAQAMFEKQRTYEEELMRSYQKNQEMLLQSALARIEKLKALEEDLRKHLEANKGRQRITMAVPMPLAAAKIVQVKKPDEFLEELRQQNPEWEARRQAALQRKADRMQHQESQESISSDDSSSVNSMDSSSASSVTSSASSVDLVSVGSEDFASTHNKDSSTDGDKPLAPGSNYSPADASDTDTVAS